MSGPVFGACSYPVSGTVQVKKLQRQLEKEIELHVALAEAVTQNAPPPALNSSAKIPPEVQELFILHCHLLESQCAFTNLVLTFHHV